MRMAACVLFVTACGDNVDNLATAQPASVEVEVVVPAGLNTPPFDVPRTLLVPPGFGIRVIARVPHARFLAETPEGDLLVSKPDDSGSISLPQPRDGQIFKITDPHGVATVAPIASNLLLPHDMVFVQRAGTTYLYLSEHDRITRTPWTGTIGALEVIADDFPSVSSQSELMGAYGHALKNIAISGDDLYISVSSSTNADPSDVTDDPQWPRGAVYKYPADGGTGRVFAKGLRNAEGLAFHPTTGELWVAVNNRDNLGPTADYINDHPAELFTHLTDGGNYGWPYCNPNPDNGWDNLPFDPDPDNNANQQVVSCATMTTVDKGMPAHSAPLGLSFWTGDLAPSGYKNGAVIGQHGCWNCTVVHGYEVVFLAPRDGGGFADQQPLVTGFFPDADGDPAMASTEWGRPVDVIPNARGDLYISDDTAGAVYELYRL